MIQPKNLSELSLKSLKVALVVSETNNVSKAANQLNRSQSAISKAIQGLEQKLEVTLFDRSPIGMTLTSKGFVLIAGIEEAVQQFQYAAKAYAKITNQACPIGKNPIFDLNISYSRLQALLLVQEASGVKEAAQQMQVSRTSLYDAIHFIEQLLDIPLFERNACGNVATPFCLALARHIRLAFTSMQNALDSIASEDGAVRGKVVIVAFPVVRNYLLPAVCVQVRREHPGIEILLKDGLYRDVESQLRSGEIDFLVGTFYEHEQVLPDDLEQTLLFKAPLQMIVRKDHPLLTISSISNEDLKAYSWILPPARSPARQIYQQRLDELGLEGLDCQIEAYSYSLQREILCQSNSIGLAFQHQSVHEENSGLLRALPITLSSPISLGITQRKYTSHSSPAKVLQQALLEMAENIGNCSAR